MNPVVRNVLCLFAVAACSSEPVDFTPDCGEVTYSFSDDVAPLIDAHCATNSGCHAAGSTRGPGALLTYQQVYNARNAIRTAVASGKMPQGSTLTTAEKNAILCWIDSGTTDN